MREPTAPVLSPASLAASEEGRKATTLRGAAREGTRPLRDARLAWHTAASNARRGLRYTGPSGGGERSRDGELRWPAGAQPSWQGQPGVSPACPEPSPAGGTPCPRHSPALTVVGEARFAQTHDKVHFHLVRSHGFGANGALETWRESAEVSPRRGEEPTPHPAASPRPRRRVAPHLQPAWRHATPRRAPAHPVPAQGTTDSRLSRRAGRPRARGAEGTASVPRQRARGHQLLPGLKGRGAARGMQHPAAGKCRGTSPCRHGAVPAAEPEKLRGTRFFCRAAAELAQGRGASPNRCFLQLFAGVRCVLAPLTPASSPRSPQADVPS